MPLRCTATQAVFEFVTMVSAGRRDTESTKKQRCRHCGGTVFVQSDGGAVPCGGNQHRQCQIPPLVEGMSYTQVSAAWQVLLEVMVYTQVSAGWQDGIIQCFSEVMEALLLVEGVFAEMITFHLWWCCCLRKKQRGMIEVLE